MNKRSSFVLILSLLSMFSIPSFAEQSEAKITSAENSKKSAGMPAENNVPAAKENAASNLVDINLSSREQLMTLPGIGENEARKIIEGRPYFMKTQLVKKGVISDDLFYGIVSKITIDLDALDRETKKETKKTFETRMRTNAKKIKTRSGLVYQDLVKGTGKSASAGKTVKVHYTGWLADGTKFDSSIDRNEPYTFVLGKGDVIKGWDEGIISMKIGGKRRLIIPPKLGYGKEGAGNMIPPNATLIFEVELLEIEE